MSQLPEAVDEALAGLAVDSARVQHGLALLHELRDTSKQNAVDSGKSTRTNEKM